MGYLWKSYEISSPPSKICPHFNCHPHTQVQLTADYAPSKLMDFLTASQFYPLEAALSICQRRGMVSEQVYILGRMGNARQALHLIIEKLGDIPQVFIL